MEGRSAYERSVFGVRYQSWSDMEFTNDQPIHNDR